MSDFYLLEDEISADYIKHVLHLAEQQGLAINKLLKIAQLDFNPLEPEYSHIKKLPTRHYEKLCRGVQHTLKEFSFGDTRLVDSFELLCHCIESAENLQEAIGRIEKFINLTHIHGQPIHCRHDKQAQQFRFSYINVRSNWDDIVPLQLEAHILFFWHRLFSWLIDDYITLEKITIGSAELDCGIGPEGLFDCPIIFHASDNSLQFSSSYLLKPITRGKKEFSELLQRSEYNFFLITDSHVMPVAKQVQLLLDRDYPGQLPPLDLIAEQLHMSASSLRRHLKREKSSYQAIKDRLYMQRASSLLQTNKSISDIAEQMGFNDSSCFQRSFKRWTGNTPGNFRQRLLAGKTGPT